MQKKCAHSKVGSVGSKEMTFFGILKIGPLELIYVIYDWPLTGYKTYSHRSGYQSRLHR